MLMRDTLFNVSCPDGNWSPGGHAMETCYSYDNTELYCPLIISGKMGQYKVLLKMGGKMNRQEHLQKHKSLTVTSCSH